jgi:anti-sigma regulatory factor (Ser/Thr protein kinase)
MWPSGRWWVGTQVMADNHARASLPNPVGPVRAFRVSAPRQLHELRALVREAARANPLSQEGVEALVTAITEAATNSLQHGGGLADVRVWGGVGGLVCEVSDSGHIKDPSVGQRPPPAGHLHGRGLWLVHQLCDSVELYSGPSGTVVRMYIRS